MRFALEKALNTFSTEFDRIRSDFERSIDECDIYDEKACDELEKKIKALEKENYPKTKKAADLELYFGNQMQEILEEMKIKKES